MKNRMRKLVPVVIMGSALCLSCSLSFASAASDAATLTPAAPTESEKTLDQDTIQSPLYASQKDMDISRSIRKALINDRSLSKKARNIDIISNDGHVTLIGPVQNKKEINKILSTSRRIDGVSTITSELSVGLPSDNAIDPMEELDRGGDRVEKR